MWFYMSLQVDSKHLGCLFADIVLSRGVFPSLPNAVAGFYRSPCE